MILSFKAISHIAITGNKVKKEMKGERSYYLELSFNINAITR